MQTFMPYRCFGCSAAVLDTKRLGKQRVEVIQILNAMSAEPGTKAGWINHPATRMWADTHDALCMYGMRICEEWKRRGYKDTCYEKIAARRYSPETYPTMPTWLGDDAFHASHRSNLLRKDSEWYSQFGWTESNDLEYVWPV